MQRKTIHYLPYSKVPVARLVLFHILITRTVTAHEPWKV